MFDSLFRQVTPTENNRAAKSLSKDVQSHNLKLVKVNARVTLVVWILEDIANLSIAILWVFVYGSTSFGTMTNSMIWYYLIISYTFLMNTSYNKDRIISDGWKIVIMNSIKSIGCNFRASSREAGTNNTQNTTHELSKSKNIKKDIKENGDEEVPSCAVQRETSANLDLNENSVQRTKADIFMISTPEIEHFPVSHTSKHTLKDLEQFHVTSMIDGSVSNRPGWRPLQKDLSTDSESVFGDTNQPKSHRVRMGEKLLSEMIKQLTDENAYIHYFKQLVELEELTKSKDLSSSTKFEIQPFIAFQTTTRSEVKNKNTKIHKNRRKNDKMISKTKKSQTEAFEQPVLNTKLSGEQLIRRQLRTEILKEFPSNVYCEDDYDKFVNNLLNLEEGLINVYDTNLKIS